MLPLPGRFRHASWFGLLLLLGPFLSLIQTVCAADTQYVQYTNENEEVVYLADDRRPALYTQNFGDCLGNSLINVTRFDAAYYKDNMTVLFHLEGNTAVANESVMRMLQPLWTWTRGANVSQCILAYLLTEKTDLTLPSTHAMPRFTGRSTSLILDAI